MQGTKGKGLHFMAAASGSLFLDSQVTVRNCQFDSTSVRCSCMALCVRCATALPYGFAPPIQVSAMFSNAKDVGKLVLVEGGRIRSSEDMRPWIAVKSIGRFTDGSKRIISVENSLGGKVTLDGNATFLNPLSSEYAGTMISMWKMNALFERCHIESAQVCCFADSLAQRSCDF